MHYITSSFFIRRTLGLLFDLIIGFLGMVFILYGYISSGDSLMPDATFEAVVIFASIVTLIWFFMYFGYIPKYFKKFKGATLGNYIFKIGVEYKKPSLMKTLVREAIIKYALTISSFGISAVVFTIAEIKGKDFIYYFTKATPVDLIKTKKKKRK